MIIKSSICRRNSGTAGRPLKKRKRGGEREKKTRVCTGKCSGSETSLNTVVRENVEVYYRVIHLKCSKRQALRRVKDAFNPPTKCAM